MGGGGVKKIGFIPHYLDKGKEPVSFLSNSKDVHTIDIQMPKSVFKPSILNHYKEFIDEVNSCDVIIASCLHGLIVADAYDKPTLWLKFGDDIGGDDIKFYDYYASMGIQESDIAPVVITGEEYSPELLRSMATKKPVSNVDILSIMALNPFK